MRTTRLMLFTVLALAAAAPTVAALGVTTSLDVPVAGEVAVDAGTQGVQADLEILAPAEEEPVEAQSTTTEAPARAAGGEPLSRHWEEASPTAKAAGAATLAVAAAYLLSKLEVARGLWRGAGAIALAPFYSRIGKSEVLDNDARSRIFDHVKAQPGVAMKAIADDAGCGWGATVYHLERLEDAGLVTSRRDAGRRRFFAVGHVAPDARQAVGLLRNERTKRVAECVLASPGVKQKDVCEALGVSASTAHKYLGRLEEANLVKREREWRSVHYYPSETLTGLMDGADVDAGADVAAAATPPAAAAGAVPA